ncbi:YeaC family protein [Photobacterium kasasachensis]|uniref:YeaC family protein n=1 Tax=Photobacterium kasasachensis TaxID=2910240 RepID=UPI003D11701B
MELEQLLKVMTPEVYQRIITAVEIGKWPDGTSLTQEQRDSAMQAVMIYQSRHNTDAEHMSVEAGGEIKFKSKAELKRDFGVKEPEHDDIARFDHSQL